MLRTLNDSEFLSSVSKRWATATLIHHGVPQVSSASNFHTSPKLSIVASPDISVMEWTVQAPWQIDFVHACANPCKGIRSSGFKAAMAPSEVSQGHGRGSKRRVQSRKAKAPEVEATYD